MGFDKLLAPLAGKTVLEHALDRLAACRSIRRIVVVCPVGRLADFEKRVADAPRVAALIEGGALRADSVAAGAEVLVRLAGRAPDYVAVHDAARPLVDPRAIEACFQGARRAGAAALAEPVADTLHRCDDAGQVIRAVPRKNLWRVQTPQILQRDDLLRISRGSSRRQTDEISALSRLGRRAILVEHASPNFKLTTPADFALAEALLRKP